MEIWADNKRIRFVLHNLLSNAFNHVRFPVMFLSCYRRWCAMECAIV